MLTSAKNRYFVVRSAADKEAVGIAKVSANAKDPVWGITTNSIDTYLEIITEAEYETHRELGLFPGFGVHGVFGQIVIYDAKVYQVKGYRVVKRSKSERREKRKRKKMGWL